MRFLHRTFSLNNILLLLLPCIATTSLADWQPKVYNAIKWSEPNQGIQTINYTSREGITLVPIAYHGGVDWNESGDISQSDIERFTAWVHQKIPTGYCGPIVMDYEKPWRKELSQKELNPGRLQEILSVYGEGVRIARGVAPTAQWGYWGMPLLRNTGASWREQGLSMKPLTEQCTALYPDIYDASRGNEQVRQVQEHITATLELAGGQIPVYVFVSPRYAGEGGDRSQFVPDDVFLRRANAAMKAVWIDEMGNRHKIQGLILWDAYSFTPESEWKTLDETHTYYFKLLQALVKAWEKQMVGQAIQTNVNDSSGCQYGMPEPQNSSETLSKQVRQDGHATGVSNEEVPQIENERLPSGRIPSNRIDE
jgi:hypothetical protein